MSAAESPLLLVAVNDISGEVGVDEEGIARLLDFAYRGKRKKPACLDLLISGDAEMTRMNRRHLGRDDTTDVLAFEDGEDEDGRLRLGDVAVNAAMARRVAAGRGGAFGHELAFYALHGLFHLLGMDDATDTQRAKMLRLQAGAMRDFGIDPGEIEKLS